MSSHTVLVLYASCFTCFAGRVCIYILYVFHPRLVYLVSCQMCIIFLDVFLAGWNLRCIGYAPHFHISIVMVILCTSLTSFHREIVVLNDLWQGRGMCVHNLYIDLSKNEPPPPQRPPPQRPPPAPPPPPQRPPQHNNNNNYQFEIWSVNNEAALPTWLTQNPQISRTNI